MPKSNIKISRYNESELPSEARCADGQFAWEASVEPESGDWVMFVPKDKTREPSLWIRVGTNDHGDGTGEDVYAEAGSEEHQAYLAAK